MVSLRVSDNPIALALVLPLNDKELQVHARVLILVILIDDNYGGMIGDPKLRELFREIILEVRVIDYGRISQDRHLLAICQL